MKRIAIHTIAMTMAALILLSFTGLRLLIHHCFACDTTDVVWAALAPDGCDSLHEKHTVDVCCSIDHFGQAYVLCCDHESGDQEAACHDCCATEHQYVRNDLRVTPDKYDVRIVPQELDVPVYANTLHEDAVSIALAVNLIVPSEPPPVHWGKDFVIFSRQLKYC